MLVRRFSINPYKVLGVDRKATESDLKSAYFKLAKKYHPDVSPGSEEMFKKVNEAYSMLRGKGQQNNEFYKEEADVTVEVYDHLWQKNWTSFKYFEEVRAFKVKKPKKIGMEKYAMTTGIFLMAWALWVSKSKVPEKS